MHPRVIGEREGLRQHGGVLDCGSRFRPGGQSARGTGAVQGYRAGARSKNADTFGMQRRACWSSDLNEELEQKARSNLGLLIAQGFGCGRIPFAPGTFGSVLGLGWFAILLSARSSAIFSIGTTGGIALSIWLCGLAEKQLHQRDPSSVVVDEIVAVPLCFVGWLAVYFEKHHALPPPHYLFQSDTWLLTAATFILFRIFDILKPWPVRQSQALPNGWGVTVDDVLAAVYTAVSTGFLAAKLLTWP